MTLHEDMDPNKAYGGIDRIWVLPADHPFNECARMHDVQYDLAREGKIFAPNSNDVDLTFLNCCLKIAGENNLLKMEAYLFYELCQVWGRWRWPKAATEPYQKNGEEKI